MDNLQQEQTTNIRLHSGADISLSQDRVIADYAAMQPELPERSLAPRILLTVLGFLGSFHLLGHFLVPGYGKFLGFHLLSLSLAGFAIAVLTGVHVYTKRLRDFR